MLNKVKILEQQVASLRQQVSAMNVRLNTKANLGQRMDDRFGGGEGGNVLTYLALPTRCQEVDAFNCKGVAVGFDPEGLPPWLPATFLETEHIAPNVMNSYAQPGGKIFHALDPTKPPEACISPAPSETNSGVIFHYALVGDTSFGRGFISPTSEAVNFYPQQTTELDEEGKEVVVEAWEIAVWCYAAPDVDVLCRDEESGQC